MAGERTIKVFFTGDNTSLKKSAAGAERAIDGWTSKMRRVAGAAVGVVALGTAMATAAAHGIALASSAAKVAGAVALVPAAVAATVASVAAARAVTSGLGEAWKATGTAAVGGGRSAADAARQVAVASREVSSAQEGLTDAQTEARRAQEALTRAHKVAAERLEDLARAETGARIDQEGAIDAVAKAERDLQKARASQSPEAIRLADRAYRQALLTLEEVRDRVGDLAAERADAEAKGVAGSDEVTAAVERQRDAQRALVAASERVADALTAVKTAGRGAGGGLDTAGEALAKLSPNGRAVILMLRSLQGGWSAAARTAQQKTFAGAAGDLKDLSATYLPGATRWLGRMAGSFNLAIRESAGLAQTRGFVADVGLFTDNTATATDRLARALRPVINGIMQFVAVGSGFLPGIAGDTLSIAERFERWAAASRESGRMQAWISDALGVLKQLGAIAGNVVGSVRSIFQAGDDGGSTLGSLVAATAAMDAWLASAEGQQFVNELLTNLRDVVSGVAAALPALAGSGSALTDTFSVMGTVMGTVADHTDTLAAVLPYLAAAYVVVKTAQLGANVAAVASLPIQTAQAIANTRLARALEVQNKSLKATATAQRGAAAATAVNTTATTAGDVAQKRSIVSTIAARVAAVATSVATKAWAAGQWLLNAALTANPIGLIVLAIVALVAGLVLAYKKSDTFRAIVDGALRAVGAAATWLWDNALKPLWDGIVWGFNLVIGAVKFWWSVLVAAFQTVLGWGLWLKDKIMAAFEGWKIIFKRVGAVIGLMVADAKSRFTAVVDFVKGIPAKIGAGLSTLKDKLLTPFKAAFNAVAGFWNRSLGSISFTVPDWVPLIAGKGWSFPKLPMLAKGGDVVAGRSYIVGDGGEPEVFTPGRSGRVTPASEAGGLGGDGVIVLDIDLGEEIHKVVTIKLSDFNRGLKRRVLAGAR